MKRTRPEAVRQIVAKQRAAEEPAITVVGGPVGMTPEVAHVLELAIDKGRRIREGSPS